MSLIDSTYFNNDIKIVTDKYSTSIQSTIDRYEPEYLQSLLGYELSELIVNYDELTSEPRIKDIIEGKEYEYNGKKYKWIGLVNTKLISPIAYYVFCKYMNNEYLLNVPSGQVAPTVENAERVYPLHLYVAAWQNMNKLNDSLCMFLQNGGNEYPELEWNEFDNINSFLI